MSLSRAPHALPLTAVLHLQAYYKVHGASLLRACTAYASGQARVGQELGLGFTRAGSGAEPGPAASPAGDASAPGGGQPVGGCSAPGQAAPESDSAPGSGAGGAAGGAGAAGASMEGAGAVGGDVGEPCTSEGFRLVMRQVLPRLEAALATL